MLSNFRFQIRRSGLFKLLSTIFYLALGYGAFAANLKDMITTGLPEWYQYDKGPGKDSLANLLKYVSTLQGTNSTPEYSYGNVYPAIALPFGMNFWSPQTGKNGNGWKYQYKAKTIRGFEETHQCSPWMNDYGVFSLMPLAGELVLNEDKRAAAFSHKNEIARPNYYMVRFDNGITTEIAPTVRGAHFRFTFPQSEKAYIVLDGYTGMSGVKIYPKEHKITGYVHNGIFIPKNFKNYFVLVFDQPFIAYGTWENKGGTISEGNDSAEGHGAGAYVRFRNGAKVQVKIASSYISPEQAARNLHSELGRFKNLDQTKQAAAKVWNKLLNRVLVEGGSDADKATFYSCLYRANLFPCKFYEYDSHGNPYYYGPNDGKIHEGYFYTDDGFWDTFRAQFPLSNILHPQMQGRYMKAILAVYKHLGWLPSWSFPAETGGVMIGNHAISLLADAWAKGIHSFNPDTALKAYFHEATNTGHGRFGRSGWKDYFTLGYVPYPEGGIGATAKTLEYAYDDFCGYQLAKMTDNKFYEGVFCRQMYNYRNVFDSATDFVRGRDVNGRWDKNFNPFKWGGPFVEGNAWHYTWSVFQNIEDLIRLMGGDKKFIAKLDAVFEASDSVDAGTYGHFIHEMREMQQADMGQYAQGNEPIQHMAYLYNYAGAPWKTQQHVRAIMSQLYNATEDGYPGDEDEGEMSSWYVSSALGIYSVCPGTDQYVIGSPVFRRAVITLESGKKFIIEAAHNSKSNIYIQGAVLNGKPYSHNWITYKDIINGGILHFEMGDQPAVQRGIKEADKPFSLAIGQ
jgi:predicted alpha-1,2-mannosidase